MCFFFIVIFLLLFLCLSFFFVYRGSWRMYVVPVIAQHNGMALYYDTALYNVAACVVLLLPQSLYLATMNQRGQWVCWMSTSRKNGLMWRTHTRKGRYFDTSCPRVDIFYACSLLRTGMFIAQDCRVFCLIFWYYVHVDSIAGTAAVVAKNCEWTGKPPTPFCPPWGAPYFLRTTKPHEP